MGAANNYFSGTVTTSTSVVKYGVTLNGVVLATVSGTYTLSWRNLLYLKVLTTAGLLLIL